jgi:peptidoglycan/xylan/chitin deacetylase (PgdA/CDA1 family)
VIGCCWAWILLGRAVGSFERLKTRTPVLTYHDMVPRRDRKALWFDCTPGEFEGQLRWMKARGARFVSVDQLYAHLVRGSKLPDHAVAITFADNYLGFYRYALPILRRRHIPVAMFVHTDFVGSPVGRPKMNWTQLKELDREGLVTIGSQTRTHQSLALIPESSVPEELVGSKRVLEERLGHRVDFLAYPNGSYNAFVANEAQRAGYRMAFTEVLKPAEKAKNAFMVPRYVHTKYRTAWEDACGKRSQAKTKAMGRSVRTPR